MSIFSGVSLATLEAQLAVAQTAYHEIAVGDKVVSLALGDQRLTFSPANLGELRQYIRDLQTAIAVLNGQPSPYRSPAVATWTR